MKKILLLLSAVAVLLLSCEDGGSDYTNYTWSDSTEDNDSDGIPDVAEKKDTTFYNMPLYDWGARPDVPDLFVHIAPMVPNVLSNGYADGGMILQKKALDRVVEKFADNGIALHFDVGNTGLYEGYTEMGDRGSSEYNLSKVSHMIPYNSSVYIKESYLSSEVEASDYVFVDDLKDDYFPSERYQVFYFMVMGSSQLDSDQIDSGISGSSGVAWLYGRDFLITLAGSSLGFGYYDPNPATGLTLDYDQIENWTVNTQASTIMHEFGHNLGLHHGGGEDQNYKPNYISIMNYLYQLDGLPEIGNEEGDRYLFEISGDSTTFENMYSLQQNIFSDDFMMDYSYGEGSSLDESALLESEGLKQSGSSSVDWNNNSTTDGAAYELDLNTSDLYDNEGIGGISVLSDYNDWGNLYLYYGNISHGISRTAEDENLEIEIEEPRDFPVPSIQRSH